MNSLVTLNTSSSARSAAPLVLLSITQGTLDARPGCVPPSLMDGSLLAHSESAMFRVANFVVVDVMGDAIRELESWR